jgi:beta-fructofuranosidase
MEMFLLQGEYDDFILSGAMYLEGKGKCGLVLRVNEQGDGYFLSLDLYKGIAQLRAWGHNPKGGHEGAFHYQQLQESNFLPMQEPYRFSLLAYGQYLELTLNDFVILSLADDQFLRGRIGFYAEGAMLRVEGLTLSICGTSTSSDYPETLAGL